MAPMKKMVVRPVRKSAEVRQVVNSILNARIEHKRSGVVFAVNSAAAGAITPITQGIVQGDDLNQRSGDQIIMERIDYTITSVNASALGVPSNLRVILFQDRLNTGSTPAITDVLTAATPNDAYLPINQQSRRFKVIDDFYLNTVGGGPLTIASREFHHKLRDKIQYNAATNVAGANGKGAVFMIFLDNAAATNYRVAMNLTYTDA